MSAASSIAAARESAQEIPIARSSANDYSEGQNWLCRPGRVDACSIDLTATVISATGQSRIEPYVGTAQDPSFDCFYIYPTVSLQNKANSNMVQESEEFNRIRTQFARYGSVCRLYAPMYSQLTLTAMAPLVVDQRSFNPRTQLPASPAYAVGYEDVLAAWRYYLKNDNKGRGVILVGHSQGSFILLDLLRKEIDGKPLQKQLIAAHLGGVVLSVPAEKDVGGTLKSIPVCRRQGQAGCVVSWSAFPAASPPPEWSTGFGATDLPGMVNNCSNPAELSGDGSGLRPYFDSSRHVDGDPANARWPWLKNGTPISTPLVSFPALFKARCIQAGRISYLAISMTRKPDDQRTSKMPGAVYIGMTWLNSWGLHDADLEYTLGNLVKLARIQGDVWLKARSEGR
ncbi:DUF3089 domain-containing protein [Pseudoduganella sp. UC29_106]|uniref:DUF3089 domain-containing protein n=1 Tax=Pseudoduganella sp. UC29_106 TaxID=3374553 RepID=UPI003756CE94